MPKVELLAFLKEYLASPRCVGGFAPSSKKLAEMITDVAGVREARAVVEFGPGTGVFTEVIARKMPRDAFFAAVEIREDFVRLLKEKYPRVCIYHGSAAHVKRYLVSAGRESCDCIVSGLPFALFEDHLQEEILDAAVEVLRPGGVFVTFSYFFSPALARGRKFRGLLESRFANVEKTPTVWLNLFPAFAYRATK